MYEIAGETATGLTSADLLGREIVFEFPPDLWIPTGVVLDVQGGKHRLRLATAEIQIQRQLAAVLMLPSPRRVNDTGSSPQLLANKAYVVERVHLDFTNHLSPDTAVVVPGRIELRNLTNDFPIPAQRRLAMLRSVWWHSPQLPEAAPDISFASTKLWQRQACQSAGTVNKSWRASGERWVACGPNATPGAAGDLLANPGRAP